MELGIVFPYQAAMQVGQETTERKKTRLPRLGETNVEVNPQRWVQVADGLYGGRSREGENIAEGLYIRRRAPILGKTWGEIKPSDTENWVWKPSQRLRNR